MDVFADSIAEMTWYEVEHAAKAGAILLWPIGVIEQHGPHLPIATDIYLPTDRVRRIKSILAAREITALIMPPFYWGINVVSGSFPASYGISPTLMRDVLSELLVGFCADGFERVFCFSGHGDALHNQTIYQSISKAIESSSADISFVVDAGLAQRLKLEFNDPLLTLHGGPEVKNVESSSPS